jgi:hypothetical protein
VKLTVVNIRALTLADVVDLPPPPVELSRHKTLGIPCGVCGADVYHSRASRTTVPACDDCRLKADLLGHFICRDADHVGDRVVGCRSVARQWRDPLLDICVKCYRRRHPGRKVVALDDHPARDHNRGEGRLNAFVSALRLVNHASGTD